MAEPPVQRRRADDDAAPAPAPAVVPRFGLARSGAMPAGMMVVPYPVIAAIEKSWQDHGDFRALGPNTQRLAHAMMQDDGVWVFRSTPMFPSHLGRLMVNPRNERALQWRVEVGWYIYYPELDESTTVAANEDLVRAVIESGELPADLVRVQSRYLRLHPACDLVYAYYPTAEAGWQLMPIHKQADGRWRSGRCPGYVVNGIETTENLVRLSVRFYVPWNEFDPLGVPETLDMPLAIRGKRALARREGTDWRTLNNRLRRAEAHPRLIGLPLYADLGDRAAPSSVRFHT